MSINPRILHVIPSLGPLRGGPSAMAHAMAQAQACAGLHVDVVATDDNGPGRLAVPPNQPLVEAGVTYRYFPRQTRFYTASWPLARWLDAHVAGYDLLHIHALFSFASVAAALCAARRGVPYIVRPLGVLNRYGMTRRRPLFKQLSFALIERHVLAGAAVVHYTSEQERIEAAELGVPHRAMVIPLPVKLSTATLTNTGEQLHTHYPQLAGRTVVLFLSRLDPKKGLDLLLPAFAQARTCDPRLALLIAGDGEPAFVAGLKSMAEKLGIDNDVLWTGFLDGEAKLAALAGADLFVLPSYSENFGVAVVEAMAASLPVIVSDQVGIHNEVAAAGAGLVAPCAVEPLATALTTLAADGERRQTMGVRGRLLAQQCFAPAAVTESLIDLYEQIVYESTDAERHLVNRELPPEHLI